MAEHALPAPDVATATRGRPEGVATLFGAALACPVCRGALYAQPGQDGGAAASYRCGGCENVFRAAGNIPVLLPPGIEPEDPHHGHGHDVHKHGQSAYYDQQREDEFEIERPRGAGRLYEYLLRFKFERGMELLGEPVAGRTALVVCAGAGMDVEFLAQRGAKVVGLDISLGALEAAEERARRHRFEARFAVGDAEHLPFPDQSFDYCYVHDGLHHLGRPELAFHELARVARRGVVITEPADAALTALAIRLGIIPAYEDAGNYVVRFTADRLGRYFRGQGFAHTASSRYLMKYPHVPNALFRLLSNAALFPIVRGFFLLVGATALAPAGNKISFAARRSAGD